MTASTRGANAMSSADRRASMRHLDAAALIRSRVGDWVGSERYYFGLALLVVIDRETCAARRCLFRHDGLVRTHDLRRAATSDENAAQHAVVSGTSPARRGWHEVLNRFGSLRRRPARRLDGRTRRMGPVGTRPSSGGLARSTRPRRPSRV